MSPLLSANYLVALGDLEVLWRPAAQREHGLVRPDPRMVDRAAIGIGRQGTLLPQESADGDGCHTRCCRRPPCAVCLLRPPHVPTHVIRPETQTVPPQLMPPCSMKPGSCGRRTPRCCARRKPSDVRARCWESSRSFQQRCLGGLPGGSGRRSAIPILPHVGVVTAAVTLAILGAAVLLDRMRLCPPWLQRLTALVDEGIPGIRRRWRERLSRPTTGSDES